MIKAVELAPNAIVDDGTLYLELGISSSATAKARRAGLLRYSKVGRRVLYLGRWVLEWLEHADGEAKTAHA
jgi:hypothetical protein